jgi:uncharacterized protein
MPVAVSYPGVYVEEIPSGVRTITGVATSITAFLGRADRGPINESFVINSYGDFERNFGGLGKDYPMSYAVKDFYLNGGGQAIIVRIFNPDRKAQIQGASDQGQKAAAAVAKAASEAAAVANPVPTPQSVVTAAQTSATAEGAAGKTAKAAADAVAKAASDAAAIANPVPTAQSVATAAANAVDTAAADAVKGFTTGLPTVTSGNEFPKGAGNLMLEALSPGTWGDNLRVRIDTDGITQNVADSLELNKAELFNLTVHDTKTGATEKFLSLNVGDNPRRIDRVLKDESSLLRVTEGSPIKKPTPHTAALDPTWKDDNASTKLAGGSSGSALDDAAYLGSQSNKTGLYALENADLFNLLCIPPDTRGGNQSNAVYTAAMKYCSDRRAFLIVDSPAAWKDANTVIKKLDDMGLTGTEARNAALYFPRVKQADPLSKGQIDTFVPCGLIAGAMARTDSQRGVWKAPAGIDVSLNGIQGLDVNLTDPENGQLNPLGVNCLRSFPVYGRVVWGARTRRGADQLADEWKYVPVRRTALYIEESLFRGLKWVVFEPNDEPLWAQVRLNVGAFMHDLFRQGAFQGVNKNDAYFVKCDKETTTQNDVNLGIVNIVVGFAPLKPAEFVVIKLQQMAGQIEV